MRFRTFRGCFLIIFFNKNGWLPNLPEKLTFNRRLIECLSYKIHVNLWKLIRLFRVGVDLSLTLHLVRPLTLDGYVGTIAMLAGAPNSSSTAHLKYINIVYNIIISNWETTKAIPQIQVTCIINCCLWHGMVELIATNHVYISSGVSAYNFYPSKYQISFLSVLRCKSKTPPSSFSSAHNPPHRRSLPPSGLPN